MPTVILLETDQLDQSLSERAAAPGLLEVAGRPMVRHAVRAFAACGSVDRIVLAGPTAYEAIELPGVDDRVLDDRGPTALLAGLLERYGDAEEWLLWQPNAPLIEPPMLDAFLAHAPLGAAVCGALVRAERVEAAFGELPRLAAHTFVHDRLVMTPLFGLSPACLAPHRELLGQLFGGGGARVELLKRLGVGFAIKLRSGRASLAELAARLGEQVGGPVVMQILPHPELCLKVASRAEHRVARSRLEGR